MKKTLLTHTLLLCVLCVTITSCTIIYVEPSGGVPVQGPTVITTEPCALNTLTAHSLLFPSENATCTKRLDSALSLSEDGDIVLLEGTEYVVHTDTFDPLQTGSLVIGNKIVLDTLSAVLKREGLPSLGFPSVHVSSITFETSGLVVSTCLTRPEYALFLNFGNQPGDGVTINNIRFDVQDSCIQCGVYLSSEKIFGFYIRRTNAKKEVTKRALLGQTPNVYVQNATFGGFPERAHICSTNQTLMGTLNISRSVFSVSPTYAIDLCDNTTDELATEDIEFADLRNNFWGVPCDVAQRINFCANTLPLVRIMPYFSDENLELPAPVAVGEKGFASLRSAIAYTNSQGVPAVVTIRGEVTVTQRVVVTTPTVIQSPVIGDCCESSINVDTSIGFHTADHYLSFSHILVRALSANTILVVDQASAGTDAASLLTVGFLTAGERALLQNPVVLTPPTYTWPTGSSYASSSLFTALAVNNRAAFLIMGQGSGVSDATCEESIPFNNTVIEEAQVGVYLLQCRVDIQSSMLKAVQSPYTCQASTGDNCALLSQARIHCSATCGTLVGSGVPSDINSLKSIFYLAAGSALTAATMLTGFTQQCPFDDREACHELLGNSVYDQDAFPGVLGFASNSSYGSEDQTVYVQLGDTTPGPLTATSNPRISITATALNDECDTEVRALSDFAIVGLRDQGDGPQPVTVPGKHWSFVYQCRSSCRNTYSHFYEFPDTPDMYKPPLLASQFTMDSSSGSVTVRPARATLSQFNVACDDVEPLTPFESPPFVPVFPVPWVSSYLIGEFVGSSLIKDCGNTQPGVSSFLTTVGTTQRTLELGIPLAVITNSTFALFPNATDTPLFCADLVNAPPGSGLFGDQQLLSMISAPNANGTFYLCNWLPHTFNETIVIESSQSVTLTTYVGIPGVDYLPCYANGEPIVDPSRTCCISMSNAFVPVLFPGATCPGGYEPYDVSTGLPASSADPAEVCTTSVGCDQVIATYLVSSTSTDHTEVALDSSCVCSCAGGLSPHGCFNGQCLCPQDTDIYNCFEDLSVTTASEICIRERRSCILGVCQQPQIPETPVDELGEALNNFAIASANTGRVICGGDLDQRQSCTAYVDVSTVCSGVMIRSDDVTLRHLAFVGYNGISEVGDAWSQGACCYPASVQIAVDASGDSYAFNSAFIAGVHTTFPIVDNIRLESNVYYRHKHAIRSGHVSNLRISKSIFAFGAIGFVALEKVPVSVLKAAPSLRSSVHDSGNRPIFRDNFVIAHEVGISNLDMSDCAPNAQCAEAPKYQIGNGKLLSVIGNGFEIKNNVFSALAAIRIVGVANLPANRISIANNNFELYDTDAFGAPPSLFSSCTPGGASDQASVVLHTHSARVKNNVFASQTHMELNGADLHVSSNVFQSRSTLHFTCTSVFFPSSATCEFNQTENRVANNRFNNGATFTNSIVNPNPFADKSFLGKNLDITQGGFQAIIQSDQQNLVRQRTESHKQKKQVTWFDLNTLPISNFAVLLTNNEFCDGRPGYAPVLDGFCRLANVIAQDNQDCDSNQIDAIPGYIYVRRPALTPNGNEWDLESCEAGTEPAPCANQCSKCTTGFFSLGGDSDDVEDRFCQRCPDPSSDEFQVNQRVKDRCVNIIYDAKSSSGSDVIESQITTDSRKSSPPSPSSPSPSPPSPSPPSPSPSSTTTDSDSSTTTTTTTSSSSLSIDSFFKEYRTIIIIAVIITAIVVLIILLVLCIYCNGSGGVSKAEYTQLPTSEARARPLSSSSNNKNRLRRKSKRHV